MPPLEMEIVSADGSTVPVLLAGTMLGREPLHGVTWVLDISERRRAEREREEALATAERARAEAEAANRAKDRFLAMLGHELRNPLSAVRNAVVSARLDPSRSERALDTALRQSDRLTRLIDDLLDVARITHGRIALRRQDVHVSEVVAAALESTRGLIEDRGHRLVTSLPAPELCVQADPARLEQVLVNLLSNATQYTEPGGRIELSVERDGDAARIRVRDSGIGIAAEMLAHVFDAFAQADDSLDRRQSGLGLGLALVKTIVELHGGRVAAASAGLGHGSEFTLWLPALPAQREDTPAPAAPHPVRTARARIVLVEDNADAADSLVTLLEILGHRVRHFADGASALAAVATDPPDLMLVDVGLPGIDGYEVARRARQTPALGGAMLVALTGYGRDEDRDRALAAGFDRHLVKPAPPHVLQALVAELPRRTP
jgi:signal transduction histidine kinase/CheY-like chemotaxis protein